MRSRSPSIDPNRVVRKSPCPYQSCPPNNAARPGEGRRRSSRAGRGQEPAEELRSLPVGGTEGGPGQRGRREDERWSTSCSPCRDWARFAPASSWRRSGSPSRGGSAGSEPTRSPRSSVSSAAAADAAGGATRSRLTVLAGPTAVGKGTLAARVRERPTPRSGSRSLPPPASVGRARSTGSTTTSWTTRHSTR